MTILLSAAGSLTSKIKPYWLGLVEPALDKAWSLAEMAAQFEVGDALNILDDFKKITEGENYGRNKNFW